MNSPKWEKVSGTVETNGKITFVLKGTSDYGAKVTSSLTKDKITVLPYTNLLQYPLTLNSIGADFIIAPLKENVFNKCKSNLKYLESCAVGAVCVGSSFEFSPYSMIDDMAKINWSMTAKQLEYNIFELCKKDNYNRVLDKQYNYINENWLENNIDKYLEIFSDKIVGI